MKEPINPISLLSRPESVLVIDLLEHALAVSDEFLSNLVPPPEGIYIKGSMRPLVDANKDYYYRSLYGKEANVIRGSLDINAIADDVLDEKGNVVISLRKLPHVKKYMSYTPDIPVMCIEAALTSVAEYMEVTCKHHRGVDIGIIDSVDLFKEGNALELEEEFSRLLDQVCDFVKNDTWHIYMLRMKSTTLIIEKIIDYRIYWYHAQEWDKYSKENDDVFGFRDSESGSLDMDILKRAKVF